MNVLKRLIRLFLPYWRWMGFGMLVSLLVVLANMALLGTAGWFLAAMAAAGATGEIMNYLSPAAAIRAFAIVRTGGRYLERLVTHEATLRFLSGLRVWFYEHIEPLAPAGLQGYQSGDLLSRISADIDALDNLYLRTLVPMAVALVSTLLAFFFLSCYSLRLALVDLSFLALAGAAVPLMARRLGSRPGTRMVETSSRLRLAAIDAVQGMGELVAFGAAHAHLEQADQLSHSLMQDQDRMSRITGSASAAFGLIVNLSVWLATFIGITLVRSQQITAADLPMLVLVVMGSFEGVALLPQAYQYLGHTLAAAERIFSVIDAPLPVFDPPGASPKPHDSGLELRGVSLRYSSAGPWVLADIQLDLAPGRHVAIIGPSGAGKSSLISVLVRFRDYERGEIRLGGNSLRAYRAEDLRSMMSVVSQQLHLFNVTVRENLLLSAPDADQARIEAAAKAAQIHEDIMALPDAYDSYVGEAGLKLSGGQIRRLAIARALLKDAPILILDEPTEGLDAATEHALMDSLAASLGNRTLLLITHRLAGLDRMDEIVVLDGGRIIERGTHAQLLGGDTRYRQMHAVLASLPEPAGPR
ncbi:MAG: thiol reductant ABC exporter subunit CydC [Gammaproteobacteria bacterium]|nr:thiol reductant ABC exporter subunit CydC [Gammaproteobacteria bacterium]